MRLFHTSYIPHTLFLKQILNNRGRELELALKIHRQCTNTCILMRQSNILESGMPIWGIYHGKNRGSINPSSHPFHQTTSSWDSRSRILMTRPWSRFLMTSQHFLASEPRKIDHPSFIWLHLKPDTIQNHSRVFADVSFYNPLEEELHQNTSLQMGKLCFTQAWPGITKCAVQHILKQFSSLGQKWTGNPPEKQREAIPTQGRKRVWTP